MQTTRSRARAYPPEGSLHWVPDAGTREAPWLDGSGGGIEAEPWTDQIQIEASMHSEVRETNNCRAFMDKTQHCENIKVDTGTLVQNSQYHLVYPAHPNVTEMIINSSIDGSTKMIVDLKN